MILAYFYLYGHTHTASLGTLHVMVYSPTVKVLPGLL